MKQHVQLQLLRRWRLAEDDIGHVVDLQQMEEEALEDEEYQLLHECVANNGWADRKNLEPCTLQPYFRMRRHLSCQGDLVIYTCDERAPRLVIPASLRRTVLTNLHAGSAEPGNSCIDQA